MTNTSTTKRMRWALISLVSAVILLPTGFVFYNNDTAFGGANIDSNTTANATSIRGIAYTTGYDFETITDQYLELYQTHKVKQVETEEYRWKYEETQKTVYTYGTDGYLLSQVVALEENPFRPKATQTDSTIYYYNDQGDVTQTVRRYWLDSLVQYITNFALTYNDLNLLATNIADAAVLPQSQLTYDTQNRKTVEKQYNEDEELTYEITYLYDKEGRLKEKKHQCHNAYGIGDMTSCPNITTTFLYDAKGRQAKRVEAYSTNVRNEYDYAYNKQDLVSHIITTMRMPDGKTRRDSTSVHYVFY